MPRFPNRRTARTLINPAAIPVTLQYVSAVVESDAAFGPGITMEPIVVVASAAAIRPKAA